MPSYIEDAIEQQQFLMVPEHERTDIYRYRYLSSFRLMANDLPHIKGYDLLVKYGYHSQSNPDGVVKDHRLSIKAGFTSKINPELLLSHPCNCEFLQHKTNIAKYSRSSVTLAELQEEIERWNKRVGMKIKRWKVFE